MSDAVLRKKLPVRALASIAEARELRVLASSTAAPRSIYAAMMARARAAGLTALCVIAPLGALAGSVSACGAAAPTRPSPTMANGGSLTVATPTDGAWVAPPTGSGVPPAPLTGIAPPAQR